VAGSNQRHEKALERYHNLSLSESTFSMLKAKFGDALRSKTDTHRSTSCCKKPLPQHLLSDSEHV
jgi:hypothetical protein